jgi:hypothetical protein
MIGALIVGLGVLLIALWLSSRARRYARLFADPHLLEIGRGLARVKAAALAHVIRDERDEPMARDDPRILATSAGLAIVYTVSERELGFVHHCSVSVIGGPTAHAVGGTFVLFVAKLLGLTPAELRCSVAASTVHHAELSLDAARHAALAARPVPELGPAALAALRRGALEARGRVTWQRPSAEPAGANPS